MSQFYTIQNSGKEVSLYLYGDIVMDQWGKWTDDDTCPSDITKVLESAGSAPLKIHINSGGGSVFGGMAIYSVLAKYKGKKTVYVDGIAASIASIIMLAGDELHIPSNAMVMIHKPWAWASGDAEDLKRVAGSLETCYKSMLSVYEGKLKEGTAIKDLENKIETDKEVWLTGEEASAFFNVEVDQALELVAYKGDLPKEYAKLPPGVAKARDEPGDGNGIAGALVDDEILKGTAIEGKNILGTIPISEESIKNAVEEALKQRAEQEKALALEIQLLEI